MALKIIELKFRGVDRFDRPVYKDVNSSDHYGSVDCLFPDKRNFPNGTTQEINDFFRKNINELEYFGNHFGCEPNGGIPKNIEFKIID